MKRDISLRESLTLMGVHLGVTDNLLNDIDDLLEWAKVMHFSDTGVMVRKDKILDTTAFIIKGPEKLVNAAFISGFGTTKHVRFGSVLVMNEPEFEYKQELSRIYKAAKEQCTRYKTFRKSRGLTNINVFQEFGNFLLNAIILDTDYINSLECAKALYDVAIVYADVGATDKIVANLEDVANRFSRGFPLLDGGPNECVDIYVPLAVEPGRIRVSTTTGSSYPYPTSLVREIDLLISAHYPVLR